MSQRTRVEDWWTGPAKRTPDFNNVLNVLRRKPLARPVLFEFALNQQLQSRLAPDFAHWPADQKYGEQALTVKAFRNAGYDYACMPGSDFFFPFPEYSHGSTISLNQGSLITDRKSFETYAWPDPASADYGRLEHLNQYLDGNMKLVIYGPYGVLEIAIALAGFENLCIMLTDDRRLAHDIFDAIGSRLLKYFQRCLQYESVGAIIGNDDWGFKTQTMLSVDDMREFVFPWHKLIVSAAHSAGKPAILHSCGNLSAVMDDIAGAIGYDGKHSYEDAIMPVENAYESYHEKIAVLGGIDVDFMVNASPDQIHRRAAAILDRTRHRGGYALGTGNSVPAYIPDVNYFAMIAAALEP
jgi:uroporphyrinogen decarboxylase